MNVRFSKEDCSLGASSMVWYYPKNINDIHNKHDKLEIWNIKKCSYWDNKIDFHPIAGSMKEN